MGYEISIGLIHNVIYVGYTSFFPDFQYMYMHLFFLL